MCGTGVAGIPDHAAQRWRGRSRGPLAAYAGLDYPAPLMGSAWYFAYGSNMQTATFRGRRGIAFTRALAARLGGWRLVLDKPPLLPIGESYANIVPDPHADVLGVAYQVPSEALDSIDLSEGVLIGNYVRRVVEILPLAGGGAPCEAFTLISDRRDASLRPSTRYMALLIEGALEHGLPPAYIDFLRGINACEESSIASALRPLLDGALALMRLTPRGRW
jgi:gamma-glutamylcyclotransferase